MIQLSHWLSAPGSPGCCCHLTVTQALPESQHSNKHGSQTSTSPRCSDHRAAPALPGAPGGGLRRGGRFSPAHVLHPHWGGLLRLPRLVRTEAERAAVSERLFVIVRLPYPVLSSAILHSSF
ncbi:hypothetical protein NQZ68_011332 [Dissostichus eleginoides]|nr:hypothetical protein NQZ68_011332 [Dissostichus eleginoides]